MIVLADGARLAATIWLPRDAAEKPVLAIHLPAIDLDFAADAEEHYGINESDPSATCADARATWQLARGDWRIRTETSTGSPARSRISRSRRRWMRR